MPAGLHRTYGAHHLHFVTWSCYRRLPFLNSARCRDRFLAVLEQVRERYRFVVVGYVVMPEHVHLLMSEPEVGSPSKVMQLLKQRTARALLPKRKRRNLRVAAQFEFLKLSLRFINGVIPSAAVLQAKRGISCNDAVCHRRSPFDAFASLACSGQALRPAGKSAGAS